jgi:hypothetical protein
MHRIAVAGYQADSRLGLKGPLSAEIELSGSHGFTLCTDFSRCDTSPRPALSNVSSLLQDRFFVTSNSRLAITTAAYRKNVTDRYRPQPIRP